MPATVQQLIQDTLEIVGEVAGAGVQTYSEERIRSDVRRAFGLIRGKFAWPHLNEWATITLNGTTGLATDTSFLALVPGIEDFHGVYFPNSNNPVPRIPHNLNPNTITGTALRYFGFLPARNASFDTHKLKFYPITATGNVDIYAGILPYDLNEPLADDIVLDFDRDMLAHACAYTTLIGDGLNADAAAGQLALMEMKFRDVTASIQRLQQAVGPASGAIPMEWS